MDRDKLISLLGEEAVNLSNQIHTLGAQKAIIEEVRLRLSAGAYSAAVAVAVLKDKGVAGCLWDSEVRDIFVG